MFHHAHGLTDGLRAFADDLRAAGHTVHLPDLYEGGVFDELGAGVAHAQEVGFGTILERGLGAAEGLPDRLVYIGWSLGVMPAQQLAQTRPGAAGAVLIAACVPPSEFGGPWPDGVPVQIHGMDADEFFAGEGDLDAARDLVASTGSGELFLYAGDAHLFADPSLDVFDEAAAGVLTQRVLRFLETVEAG